MKDEQKSRIGFRDNLIYATLASLAAIVAAALSSRGGFELLPPLAVVGCLELVGAAWLAIQISTYADIRKVRPTAR